MKTKLLLMVVAALASALPAKATVFGGFDYARGGSYGLVASPTKVAFRAHVTNAFLDVSFTSTNTLTSSYLATVDVLLIGAAAEDHASTGGLSLDEQAALYNFVLNGGKALLFSDNAEFAVIGETMVSPFGVHTDASAVVAGVDTVVVTNASHPVASGPFGVAGNYSVTYPGWFTRLGSMR